METINYYGGSAAAWTGSPFTFKENGDLVLIKFTPAPPESGFSEYYIELASDSELLTTTKVNRDKSQILIKGLCSGHYYLTLQPVDKYKIPELCKCKDWIGMCAPCATNLLGPFEVQGSAHCNAIPNEFRGTRPSNNKTENPVGQPELTTSSTTTAALAAESDHLSMNKATSIHSVDKPAFRPDLIDENNTWSWLPDDLTYDNDAYGQLTVKFTAAPTPYKFRKYKIALALFDYTIVEERIVFRDEVSQGVVFDNICRGQYIINVEPLENKAVMADCFCKKSGFCHVCSTGEIGEINVNNGDDCIGKSDTRSPDLSVTAKSDGSQGEKVGTFEESNTFKDGHVLPSRTSDDNVGKREQIPNDFHSTDKQQVHHRYKFENSNNGLEKKLSKTSKLIEDDSGLGLSSILGIVSAAVFLIAVMALIFIVVKIFLRYKAKRESRMVTTLPIHRKKDSGKQSSDSFLQSIKVPKISEPRPLSAVSSMYIGIPRVMIIYFKDSEQHRDVVHHFANFVNEYGAVDIRIHEWSQKEIQKVGTYQWLNNTMEDCQHIIVVNSRGAYERHRLLKRGKPIPDDPADPLGNMFPLALDLLAKKYETLKEKYIMVYFSYDDKEHILKHLSSGIELCLPQNMEQLYLQLHYCEEYEGGFKNHVRLFNAEDYMTTSEGKKLQDTIRKIYQRGNSNDTHDSGIHSSSPETHRRMKQMTEHSLSIPLPENSFCEGDAISTTSTMYCNDVACQLLAETEYGNYSNVNSRIHDYGTLSQHLQ